MARRFAAGFIAHVAAFGASLAERQRREQKRKERKLLERKREERELLERKREERELLEREHEGDNIKEDDSRVTEGQFALAGLMTAFVLRLFDDVASAFRGHETDWTILVRKQGHEQEVRDLEERNVILQGEIQEQGHNLMWCEQEIRDLEEIKLNLQNEIQEQCNNLKWSEQKIRELEEIKIKLENEVREQRNKLKYAAELDRYAMGTAPRGICLVINNVNFFGKEERQGAELDEQAIASLFHELHFIVKIRQNLGGQEILDAAQEMAAIDHSNYEAFVCCIMSHGDKKDFIHGVDNRKAAVEDLMSEFTPTNCPTLENKPKLFFFQACRGEKSDRRMNRLSSVLSDNNAEDGIQNSPDADLANGLSAREADFLLAFATVPGYKAWRSKQVGSWFIQELVDVIRTYHCRHHLLDMLTEVNKRVAAIANDYPDDDLSFQVPAPTHTLRAQVFL